MFSTSISVSKSATGKNEYDIDYFFQTIVLQLKTGRDLQPILPCKVLAFTNAMFVQSTSLAMAAFYQKTLIRLKILYCASTTDWLNPWADFGNKR